MEVNWGTPSDGGDFVQRGIHFAKEGLKKDDEYKLEEALRLYMLAIEYYLVGMQCE